jgi:D-3-phosphoglycerate dehydrogenase
MVKKYSLDKEMIRVVLLEGIHRSAVEYFRQNGYSNVELLPGALDDSVLRTKIQNANIIGIRSRTQLTKSVLNEARKLLAIGCFSIGTNQVDGQAAKLLGIPVFNAHFSNTRSVAELVIAESILLMRNIPAKMQLHKGK